MPFNKVTTYGESENILDSEIGLVTKTREASNENAKTDGDRKVIKAGSLFADPNHDTDIGVVFQDYDMTDYDKRPIAVVVQGRIKADKVAAEVTEKKEALAKQGIYLV